MPKLLDWYITEEVLQYGIGFYLAFLIFMIGNDLFLLLQQIQDKQIPGIVVAHMILLHSSWYMTWGLPASVLFGVLIGVGRLANDNEIMAMKTSGISLRRIQRPVLIIGIVAALGVLWIGEKVAPPALKEYLEIFYKYAISSTIEKMQPQRFLKGARNDQYFYFQSVDRDKQTVSGVLMIQLEVGGRQPVRTVLARLGEIQKDKLVLHDGVSTDYAQNGNTKLNAPFDRMEIDIGRTVDQNMKPPAYPLAMSIRELRNQIPLEIGGGSPKRKIAYFQTELYFKYSLPLAALVLAFMAFPLAARSARGGRFMSYFLALAFYSFYYVLISVSKLLGYYEVVSPVIAGWMTTGTLMIISVGLMIRGER